MTPDQIEQATTQVAKQRLGAAKVLRSFNQPASDLDGRDAIKITIVLSPGVVRMIPGDAFIDTLVDVQKKLSVAGEDRLATIEYATEEELAEHDDPEP